MYLFFSFLAYVDLRDVSGGDLRPHQRCIRDIHTRCGGGLAVSRTYARGLWACGDSCSRRNGVRSDAGRGGLQRLRQASVHADLLQRVSARALHPGLRVLDRTGFAFDDHQRRCTARTAEREQAFCSCSGGDVKVRPQSAAKRGRRISCLSYREVSPRRTNALP